MRYQVFNSRDSAEPVMSAPWLWLARMLSNGRALNWSWYRLVDTKTGETLTEWARATRNSP